MPSIRFKVSGAIVISAAFAFGQARAQTANVTPENVAVLNLLSPFLSLNATAVGQQTLQASLAQSVAINQNLASAALLNGNLSTPTLVALSISDENLLGKASNAVTGLSSTYGVAANLAGGLPTQNTTAWAVYNGQQSVGAFGTVLGAAYVKGVGSNGSAVTLPNTVNLLVAANNQIVNNLATSDSQVAKFYFANGTIDGKTTAVAPSGTSLPSANGYPNTKTSVYDTAFGVSNTQTGQNSYGNSHPYQTAPANNDAFTLWDTTVKTASTAPGAPSPSSNSAFPSSHEAYAMADSLLLGMMVPQLYQSSLLRASEMGESRIVVGVHYPTDIIASRAFAAFDLANLLSNPAYINNASVTGTAVNLGSMFTAAAPELQTQLTQAAVTSGCGTSIASCATSSVNANPYNPSATNSAIYTARLTYGLPTLSFAQAPQEQAPAGSPDASVLLATLYGGSTAAAQALAASVGGPLDGNLATSSINQVLVNTETNALAAFYGTSLSYWARLNLYAAASYFSNLTGSFTFAPGDVLNTPVTVAGTGVLSGPGTINGNLVVQAGGALAAAATGISAGTPMVVNGTTTLQTGAAVRLTGLALPGINYKVVSGTGAISVAPGVGVDVSGTTGLGTLFTGTLIVAADPGLSIRLSSNFTSLGLTANQRGLGAGLDAGGNGGGYGANGATLLADVVGNNTAASAPAVFNRLSGEGIAGQQQAALDAADLFTSTVMDAARGGLGIDSMAQTGGTRTWMTAFGQGANLDGAAGAGSAGWSASLAGFAAGTDYTFATNTTVGLAAGYSDTSFSVHGRSTTGSASAGHVGLYADQRWGAFYLSGTVDGTFFSDHENRLALDAAQSGSFGAAEALGRVEAGRAFAFTAVNVTPFGGVQVANLSNDGFSESGAGVAGLHVNSRSVNSDKIYLGAQVDTARSFENGMALSPYARIAWEHEFNTDRKISATLLSLPGSGFTVAGASASSDAARVTAGVKLDVARNVAIYAAFDGAVAGDGSVYGGKGGIRFTW